MAYRFADLVDIPRLQEMLTSLHAITGVAFALDDAGGTVLLSAGEPDICTQYLRACPGSAARCRQSVAAHANPGPPDAPAPPAGSDLSGRAGGAATGEATPVPGSRASRPGRTGESAPVAWECLNGLMNYATPVMIEGERVATLFAGQLFHEPPDEQLFRKQAQEYGFDSEAFIEALHRVPVVPKEQFQAIVTFLTRLAESLASVGLESLRLGATTAALAKSEAEAKRLGEELEQRVAARTAELIAANQELSRQEASLKQAIGTLSQREAALSAQIAQRDRAEEALHRLNADLVRAKKRSERMLHTLEAVSSSLELDQVLTRIAGELASALGFSTVVIHLLDANGELQTPQAISSDLTEDQLAFLAEQYRQHGPPEIIRSALASGRPAVRYDTQPMPEADQQLAAALKIKAALCVPLQRSGRILGVATGTASQGPRTFTPQEVELALGMAGAAALAVENAKLFEETRRLTVVEERQRLARELHDSVTQALYGVTLFAKAASSALAAGKAETAAGYLHKLRETAQEATADMRLLVFQLHPPALEKEGLVAALQARLAAVEARAGLQTEFRVEGEERRLPFDVEEELYWIAQEALNNVLKHAKASRASLCIEFKGETVTLDVTDNGIGFDAAAAGERGGVGLRSIAERAARVRGRWTLESEPGQGAHLHIEAPAGQA